MATPEGDVADQEIVPQIRIASSTSPNLQQQLLAIQRLARQVFEPDIPASQYEIRPTVAPQLQLDNWNTGLRDMDSAILYVTTENFTSSFNNGLDEPDDDHDLCLTSMQRTVDAIEEQHVAFFFVRPRVLPHAVAASIPESYLNQQKESYHIYLAAVRPDMRGRGLFQLLLDTTIVKARLCKYKVLTISTIPEKFPRMYKILSSGGTGWQVVERERVVDNDGGIETKVLLMMTL